jgi:trehalose synthase
MLQTVDVGRRSIAAYEHSAGRDAVQQLRELAKPLEGVRILHVNATPYGGGVAEILRAEIPLLRDLGIHAEWKLITGGEAFFRATKAMHNGLQGSLRGLTDIDRDVYIENAKHNAELQEQDYDLHFIHDPQPMGMLEYRGRGSSKWIEVPASVPGALRCSRLHARGVRTAGSAHWSGGDHSAGYRSREPQEHGAHSGPGERGAAVDRGGRRSPPCDPGQPVRPVEGSMALDDPEGWDIYEEIRDEGDRDPDIAIHTNLTGTGNIEVNAFQRMADVGVQLSTREGFGLVVSETLWKGTPMVARGVGGIPLQMEGGVGGVLVDTIEESARQIVRFVRDRGAALELGILGRELVRDRFLLTRMIADELKLYASVLGLTSGGSSPVGTVGPTGEVLDPVCGRAVDPNESATTVYEGRTYYFNSAECLKQFLADPDRFLRAEPQSDT